MLPTDAVKVAHPEMLKAITAAKKRNDRSDAEKICDLLRVNMLPECYMAPSEHRELRCMLRSRNHICERRLKKIKFSACSWKLAKHIIKIIKNGCTVKYIENVEYVPESALTMLRLSRSNLETLIDIQKRLFAAIKNNKIIKDRVQRLLSIQGIGEITALTWILEFGEPERFPPLPGRSAIVVYARLKKNEPASDIVVRYLKNATSIFKQFWLKRPSLRRNGIRIWPVYIKMSWSRATETRQAWRLPKSWSPACWQWIKTRVHFRA